MSHLEIRHNPQDHLWHQVAPVEAILAVQIWVHMIPEPLVRRTVVLPTIDLLDQVMGQLVLPMIEVSQIVITKEARRAGQATTLLALVLRADLVPVAP